MQRFVLVWLAAVAVLATASPTLFGQGPQSASAPLKIAFINSQEILKNTPGYAAAESTYRKELQAAENEVQRLRQQLDSAYQVFQQQLIVLSPAAKATKQKDLDAMDQRIQQRGNELRDNLARREQELLGPLNTRIRAVIEGIRAEMNYAMILDADAAGGGYIAAADPSLNITPRVLQRLNQAQ
ncbi:MAG TPA: OmpH family outer membrane protein [Gemmatimonadales bacterium]|jgi:outer membrane protein|nr:OmpH family outer membrane protein [Gemmatimonadales bacterium]